jgi:hypothetical protein
MARERTHVTLKQTYMKGKWYGAGRQDTDFAAVTYGRKKNQANSDIRKKENEGGNQCQKENVIPLSV